MQVPYALCNIVRLKETRNMKLLTTGQWFTTLFYYWLTDLVSSWNQLSEFSRWHKQNDHFGHLKSMIHNHNNVYIHHKTFNGFILHLSTGQVIKMTFNWCVSCILNYLYFVSEWWKHWITVLLDPGWDIITTKCKNNTSAFSARITLWIQQKSFSNSVDRFSWTLLDFSGRM